MNSLLTGLSFTAQRALLLVLILAQAGFLIGHLMYQRAYIEGNASRILRNTTLLEKEHFETTLVAMRYQLRVIGNAILLNHTVAPDNASPFLANELKRKWLNAAIVFDEKGDFVASQSIFPLHLALNETTLRTGSFREQALFNDFRQHDINESLFYWRSNGTDPNLVGFVMYRAIRDPHGKYLGGIVGFFNSSSMEGMFRGMEKEGFDLGPHGAMAVFDRGNAIQLARMGMGKLAGPRAHDPGLARLMNYADDSAQVHHYVSPIDGVPRMGVFLNINDGKWVLATGLAKQDVFHGWKSQAIWTAIAIIVIAVSQWLLLHYMHANALQRERFAQEARYDPLTGLANRRYFDDWTGKACRLAYRRHKPLCVIAFDLDHFKIINDKYGHDGGDAVLKAIGQTLPELIRSEDIAARFGGEEFVIAMVDTNAECALETAERIRIAFETCHVEFNGHIISFRSSFGVAQMTDDELQSSEGMKSVLVRADQALYQSKLAGRNRVSLSS